MARLHFQKYEGKSPTLQDTYCFDNYLSFKSKGLLSLLYSLSIDLDFDFDMLAETATDPTGAVRSSFKELETLGYISRKMLRDKNGRFLTVEYTVLSKPKKRIIGGDIHCQ